MLGERWKRWGCHPGRLAAVPSPQPRAGRGRAPLCPCPHSSHLPLITPLWVGGGTMYNVGPKLLELTVSGGMLFSLAPEAS